MRNRLNPFFPVIIVFVVAFAFFGCKRKNEAAKEMVTVKGSDTMVNLSQKWAEEYMKLHNDVSIQVTGGGSGTGIAALLNKTTEIANASRELKESEEASAKEKGYNLQRYEVALDGLAVIVNNDNPIDSLTIAQLSDIFSGKITNWKQVGGKDMPIILYGRENSSGTYEFFKEHVLGKDASGKPKDYATNTQVLQGTAALGEAVARDTKGVGYGGVGYFAARQDVKIIAVKKDAKSPAYYPAHNGKVNYELIWSKQYSISRYLYCFTYENPKQQIKDFINFITSSDGQKLVAQMEYIPLPSAKGVIK